MARQSLEHSFIAGESLWQQTESFRPISACAADHPGAEKPSPACQKFLDASERARVQWKLEGEFEKFEGKF
jgi:hypothetical protein